MVLWIGILISSVWIFGGLRTDSLLGKAIIWIHSPLLLKLLRHSQREIFIQSREKLGDYITIFTGLIIYPFFLVSFFSIDIPAWFSVLIWLAAVSISSFLCMYLSTIYLSFQSQKWETAHIRNFGMYEEKKGIASHSKLPVGSAVEIENPLNGKVLLVTVIDTHIRKEKGVDVCVSREGAKVLGINIGTNPTFYVLTRTHTHTKAM